MTPEERLPPNRRWMVKAACDGADPNLFFTDTRVDQGHPAFTLCRRCPVQDQCLQYALDHNEYGIWGGTTRSHRLRMKASQQWNQPAKEKTA